MQDDQTKIQASPTFTIPGSPVIVGIGQLNATGGSAFKAREQAADYADNRSLMRAVMVACLQ
jgi:hypothetical protein